jgi:hypothetical protein
MADIYGTNAPGKEIEFPPLPQEEVVNPVKQPSEIESNHVKQPSLFIESVAEPQEVHTDQQPEEVEQVEEQAHPQEPVKSVSQSNNLRTLREQNEKMARERDEAIRRVKEYEQRQNAQQNLQQETQPRIQPIEENYEFNLADDELAEGKHLSKVSSKIKQLESKLAQYEQRSVMSSTEMRLKQELPDFDKIVTVDNIKALSAIYPEIAQTLESTSDLYAKAKSAYTIIKNMGIHVENSFIEEQAVVKKNLAKPRALASVSPQQGDSPLSKANAFANGLTEELKAQLRKEMEEATRHY